MELTELTHDQKLALVALLEAVAVADGVVSDGEEREIGEVAEEFGDEVYRDLVDEVGERFGDMDELKAFLETVTDAEARDLIYGTVMDEILIAPTPEHSQAALLDWLKETWQIEVDEG